MYLYIHNGVFQYMCLCELVFIKWIVNSIIYVHFLYSTNLPLCKIFKEEKNKYCEFIIIHMVSILRGLCP